MPVFHLDHVQFDTDFIFRVEHLRQLSQGHCVNERHTKIPNERHARRVEHRAFNPFTAERVRAVKHEVRNVVFGCSLHAIAHRGDKSIETHSGALDVEDKRVYSLQHLVGWALGVAIEAINWKPSRWVSRIGNRSVKLSRDAVLWAEQ